MSLSYYNPQDRYRQRWIQRFMGVFVVVFVIGISVGIGIWLGGLKAERDLALQRGRIQSLEEEKLVLEETLTAMRADTQTALMRFEQLQEKYDDTISVGPMEELVALLKEQLEEGMDPSKLAFAIRSARPPRNCTEIETRRFVISTPANDAPASEISIADGQLIITGEGASAKNEAGAPEAWYDPARSVAITFKTESGTETKKGVMPIQNTVIIGARQYRFTIAEGARSFAKVTFDSCDYP